MTPQQGEAFGQLVTGLAASGDSEGLREFIEHLPVAVWAKDNTGRYLFANPAYARFFDLPLSTTVAGRTDDDFFSPEDARAFRHKDREIIRTGAFEQFQEPVHLATGTKHVITLKFPLRDAQGKPYAACGLCFDVTESVQHRERLEALNQRIGQREQQLLALSRSPVIDAGDVAASLQLIVAAAAQGLGVARVSVWLWDGPHESLQCILQYETPAGAHSTGKAPVTEQPPLLRHDYPDYFAALDEQRLIAAHDAWQDPRTRELKAGYLLPGGIRSMLDVPIRLAGEMAGVLCCEQVGAARQWSDDEAHFAVALADNIGRSLVAQRRWQADQALRALNQELEARVERETAEARRAEAEAQRASQQLQRITDHMPGAVCQMLWHGGGRVEFLYMSDGIEPMTGVAAARFVNHPAEAMAVVLPEDLTALLMAIEAGGQRLHEPFEFTFRVRHFITGELHHIQTQSRGTLQADGSVLFNGSFIDVSAGKRLEDTVAESERLLKAAMAASHDGVWEWNFDNDAVYYSDGWFQQLGYPPEHLPPRLETFVSLLHPDDAQTTFAAVARVVEQAASGEDLSYSAEFRLRRADGRWQWTLGRGNVSQRRADGTALRLTGTNVDIDARKQLEHSLAQASKAKSDFLANISHEIRTPMNAVMGFAQLLRKTPLDGQQAGYVDKLLGAGKTLLALVNDVLDLSRIEAGKLKLEQTPLSLKATLDTLCALASPEAEHRGLALSHAIDPDIPPLVAGDPLRLGQVLLNLLGNAVKFTESGSVTVAVQRLPAAGAELVLRFAVRDTGIGIAEERVQAIFKPFEQADGSTSRRYGGSGLGLAICQELVSLMGGELGVESTPGEGSTFWFTARFTPVAQASLPGAAAAADTSGLAGLKVLVAEDNDINLEILTELLQRVGVVVQAARDGAEAVAICATGWPELVLMDMQMPDIDGLTATRQLRADARFAALPILALTANALLEDRERCLAAGMNDHLTKPIEVEELYAKLGHWRQPRSLG